MTQLIHEYSTTIAGPARSAYIVQDGAIVFEGGEARALVDPRAWRVVRLERHAPAVGERR